MTLDKLGPVKLNTSVMSVRSHRLGPGIIASSQRFGHHPYLGERTLFGARPTIGITVPFQQAYDLMGGFTFKKLTTVELYFARQSASTRTTADGVAHDIYSLAAGAECLATFGDFGVSQDGVCFAEIMLEFIGASGGMTAPLEYSGASGTLPTLSSAPTRHTLGPVTAAGTAITGVQSIRAMPGNQTFLNRSSGQKYVTEGSWLRANPMLQIGCNNPADVIGKLALEGIDTSTTTTVELREVDASDIVSATTFTIAVRGRMEPDPVSVQVDGIASGGLQIHGISTDGTTHPWSVS